MLHPVFDFVADEVEDLGSAVIDGGADLHGRGTRHEVFDGVLSSGDPADADDWEVCVLSDVIDAADSDGFDGFARIPAGLVGEHRGCGF
jgi:hypothetical protein